MNDVFQPKLFFIINFLINFIMNDVFQPKLFFNINIIYK